MRTGEFALEGNSFLVEGDKYAIRERKKVKGKPKFYLIRCEPFQYVSSLRAISLFFLLRGGMQKWYNLLI